MSSCINIIDLNLDVLNIIFSKLEFEDQINLGVAHPNLGKCFTIRYRRRFREFDLNEFPEIIWDSLLSLCGPIVETLCCHKNALPVLKCAVKHCKSLQKINFLIGFEHVSRLNELKDCLHEFTNLNSITIRYDCVLYYDEYYNFTRTVKSWPELQKLEKLELDDFPRSAMIHIKEVDLMDDLHLDTSKEHGMEYICRVLNILRVLIHSRRRIPKNYKKLTHPCNSHRGEEIDICNRKLFTELNICEFHQPIWESLFYLCGPIVRSLDCQEKSLGVFNLALKHCNSLQQIKFVIGYQYSLSDISSKLCEFENINSIIIRNDRKFHEDSELVTMIQSFQQLPKLRKLALVNFPNDALITVRDFTQLEELNIRIPRTQEDDIENICASLKNLRVFIYKGNIEDDSLQAMSQCCPLLEKLELHPWGQMHLPYFPKLKELMVEFCVPQPLNSIMGGHAQVYAKQLDKLTISSPFLDLYNNDELLKQFRGDVEITSMTEMMRLLDTVI